MNFREDLRGFQVRTPDFLAVKVSLRVAREEIENATIPSWWSRHDTKLAVTP